MVTGRSPEGIGLAVKAIKMVEDEAHTSNLTQRIKVLLNVTDPTSQPQPTRSSSVTSSASSEPTASSIKVTTSDPGASQAESSVQMVEEPLEEHQGTAASNSHIAYSSSSTSSTGHPSLPSHTRGSSQDEKSKKTDDLRPVINSTSGDIRKTRTVVKGVHDEESKEHDYKEKDNNKEEAD